MNNIQGSYRQIMKATSIFGGVQVFNIFISLIRSKFVAVLLGPIGFGILGMLTATISMVSALTNFGLGTSAIKDISEAHASGNLNRVSVMVSVFKKLVVITGFIGTVLTLAFASVLSEITFGNREYTWAFIWISITLLINQLNVGQSVMLRATRQIKPLAKSGMLGSVLGLIFTLPLYYLFELNGIVPGIIISAFCTYIATWYYARKLNLCQVPVPYPIVLAEGKGMLKMGFLLSLSVLIGAGTSYLVRLYINSKGGIEEVGLYNAGFAIINTYVGLIFTAMATDYYPRLSAVSKSNSECRTIINHQAEIAILILSPIILVLFVFINWLVIILYSSQFILVNDMILYAALGMFFKAVSWAIGFIFLAKGALKVFFLSELLANTYIIALNIIGYKYFGLAGMGLSFLISYLLVLIQVYYISKIKYEFTFSKEIVKIFIVQFSLAVTCLISVKLLSGIYSYSIGILFICVSAILAWKELDSKLDLKSALINAKSRFRKVS